MNENQRKIFISTVSIISLYLFAVISSITNINTNLIISFFALLFLILFAYSIIYFKTNSFLNVKKRINTYVTNCNELSVHIEDLKNVYVKFEKNEYGISNMVDSSSYKYNRLEFAKLRREKNVYSCSLSVLRSAREQPFVYLCKYFNISISQNTLNSMENVLNNFLAAQQGVELLKKEEDRILESIRVDVPIIIKCIFKEKLKSQLGFYKYDFDKLIFPKYEFQYISAGGNSFLTTEIRLDIENLEKFIHFLSTRIKFMNSVAGQRRLMTQKLRETIKIRDNYTCSTCNNSTNNEPNLLLEIDHIKPLSKGGLTTEDNLQTLCWKCNRSKSNSYTD